MDMIKKIYNLFIITSLLFAAPDTDPDITVSATGAIPFCASWTNDTSVPDFSTVDILAYDLNELIFEDMITISEFEANYGFDIKASKGGWTNLPSGYIGAKKTNGSDADFLITVHTIGDGYGDTPSEGLVIANSHNDYQPLLTTGAVILSGGNTTHGVEGASFHIDGKILLDWDTDIPGEYTLAITITVESQ